MAVPREVIDRIREAVDIGEVIGRHVALQRKSGNLMGLCPFHKEKTPSFSVTPARGIFHCFGCGEGGDVFKFVQKIQGVSFIEALKELAQEAGVEIEDRQFTPEERARYERAGSLRDVCEAAAAWFEENLLVKPVGLPAREYLKGRGLTQETVRKFRLGFAPEGWSGLLDHLHARGFSAKQVIQAGLAKPSQKGQGAYDLFRARVIFPILDTQGRIVSFGGRLMEGDGPKYVNGPETDIYHKSKILYGLAQARSAVQRERRVLLVEGYFDVISLHQAGFEAAVATCGTALTRDHLKLIGRFTKRVVALFDADEAGIRAAVRSMPLLAEAEMDALRLNLPDAKDPDEFVQAHGAEALDNALQHAEPLMETVIRHECTRNGYTAAGKQESVKTLGPLIARFPDVMRAAYTRRVAEVLNLPEDVISRQVRLPRSVTQRSTGPAKQTRQRQQVHPHAPESHPHAPPDYAYDAGPPPNAYTADPMVQAIGAPPPAPPIPPVVREVLWLLIHHTSTVAPMLTATDPDLVSERMDVRTVIAHLLAGEPIVTIVASCEDSGLRNLLSELSTREDLFKEDSVSLATSQLAARLALNGVERLLGDVKRAISTCSPDLDGTRYLELVNKRLELLNQRKDLKNVLSQNTDTLNPSPTPDRGA